MSPNVKKYKLGPIYYVHCTVLGLRISYKLLDVVHAYCGVFPHTL